MYACPSTDAYIQELQAAIRDVGHSFHPSATGQSASDTARVIPVGAGTKSGLMGLGEGSASQVKTLDITAYQGIVSYEPSEFLITARAGTRIAELQDALSEHGQFLPFDPLFVDEGATLGGTVASGISGPDRLLYGGIRDFIMEVALIDGLGKVVRGGGKVVKNAAGFDIPKLMSGSCGRLGILIESTLKVFPAPQAWATLLFKNTSIEQAVRLSQRLLSQPFPIAGMDIDAEMRLMVRIAAPVNSLAGTTERMEQIADQQAQPLFALQHVEQRKILTDWFNDPLPSGTGLVRVLTTPKKIFQLNQLFNELELQDFIYTSAVCVAWVKLPLDFIHQLDQGLLRLSMPGSLVRGRSLDSKRGFLPFIGDLGWQSMSRRVQQAIDPNNRFVSWANSF